MSPIHKKKYSSPSCLCDSDSHGTPKIKRSKKIDIPNPYPHSLKLLPPTLVPTLTP